MNRTFTTRGVCIQLDAAIGATTTVRGPRSPLIACSSAWGAATAAG